MKPEIAAMGSSLSSRSSNKMSISFSRWIRWTRMLSLAPSVAMGQHLFLARTDALQGLKCPHNNVTPKKVEMERTMCSFYSTVQRDRTYCSTQLFARLSKETSGLNLVAHLVGLSTCHIAASTHTAPLSVPFR